jgi:hypothetical protein
MFHSKLPLLASQAKISSLSRSRLIALIVSFAPSFVRSAHRARSCRPERSLKIFLQRVPGAGEATHDRPRGQIKNSSCFLVRHPVAADQPDDVALIHRHLSDVFAELLEKDSIFGDDLAVAAQRISDDVYVDGLAAKSLHPLMIDPEILCDAKHPAVDSRSRLPLIQMSQRSHIGFLRQILAQIRAPRKRVQEPPQPWVQFHHPLVHITARGFRLIPGHAGRVRFPAQPGVVQTRAGFASFLSAAFSRSASFHGRLPTDLKDVVVWQRSHAGPNEP